MSVVSVHSSIIRQVFAFTPKYTVGGCGRGVEGGERGLNNVGSPPDKRVGAVAFPFVGHEMLAISNGTLRQAVTRTTMEISSATSHPEKFLQFEGKQ